MLTELDKIIYYSREELEEKYCKLYEDYKTLDIKFDNREYELTNAIDELTNDLPRNTTIRIIELIKAEGLYNQELDNLFNEFIRYELKEKDLII